MHKTIFLYSVVCTILMVLTQAQDTRYNVCGLEKKTTSLSVTDKSASLSDLTSSSDTHYYFVRCEEEQDPPTDRMVKIHQCGEIALGPTDGGFYGPSFSQSCGSTWSDYSLTEQRKKTDTQNSCNDGYITTYQISHNSFGNAILWKSDCWEHLYNASYTLMSFNCGHNICSQVLYIGTID